MAKTNITTQSEDVASAAIIITIILCIAGGIFYLFESGHKEKIEKIEKLEKEIEIIKNIKWQKLINK